MTGALLLILANLLFPFIAAGYLLYFLLTPRRGLLKRLNSELAERFVCFKPERAAGLDRPVWIHAASVGEAKSVAGLTAELKKQYPGKHIILTTSTSAGKAEANKNPGISAALLAPLDFYPLASRFIKIFKPCCLLLIETELWPSMLTACRKAGVKTAIINGRLSAKSVRAYGLIKPLMKLAFAGVNPACLQTEEIAARYRALGMPQDSIKVTGNIKYDLLSDNAPKAAQIAETLTALGWNNSRVIVCGSTHPVEEEAFAQTFSAVLARFPDYRVIAAPRHLERAEQACGIFGGAGVHTVRLTELLDGSALTTGGAQVLVADTMGWLTSFYAIATACFVGGTIAPRGGHNLLEAAVFGKPVLFGPHTGNTPETAARLTANGGGIAVTVETLADSLIQLLQDPAAIARRGQFARQTALSYTGATRRTLDALPDGFFR